MVNVLVIHGSGMNMWGKIQVDIVGPKSLEQLNSEIRSWANTLGMEVDIFQSNIEGEVVNRLYDAHDQGVAAAILNPAGWTTSTGALVTAISQVRYPVIEIHASNPAARGTTSQIQRVCKGLIFGFGYFGYYLALQGAKELGTAQSYEVRR
jgi:3-dehydroquinate dehydratase-2